MWDPVQRVSCCIPIYAPHLCVFLQGLLLLLCNLCTLVDLGYIWLGIFVFVYSSVYSIDQSMGMPLKRSSISPFHCLLTTLSTDNMHRQQSTYSSVYLALSD